MKINKEALKFVVFLGFVSVFLGTAYAINLHERFSVESLRDLIAAAGIWPL